MPLREDILTPIPGDNPSGESLRYKPVYDKIKDARREDEDWAGGKKEADWAAVIKLAGEAIATKSKDLQLAAWLTEAMLKKEGFKGLRAGLGLIQSLIETFWDTLYPEIEDGDLELRATPVDWVGSRLVDAVRRIPVTRYGYNFYQYKESRAVGYEGDASTTDLETRRMQAIDEGKITAEAFDKQFSDTPKDFYQDAVADLEGALEILESLNETSEAKFGEYHPTFTPLREALDEIRRNVNELYQKKRALAGETDAPAAPEVVEEVEPEPAPVVSSGAAAAAPARAPVRKAVVGLDPADRDDAVARLTAVAKFLRSQDASDPAPYLMLRGFRWGELRKDGASPSQELLEAPSTGVRQTLKKAMIESDWQAVIDHGEAAMAEPCGRGWLDLQRYLVTALEQWYPHIAAAVKSEVLALIKDIPDLRRWELMDGTATANGETQAWLDQLIADSGSGAEPAQASRAMQEEEEAPQLPEGEPAPPDSYELAVQAIRQGHSSEAIEILASEVGHQSSGRGRFRRKQQLAEVCIKLGKTAIAQPILEELLTEIDEHKLEQWESPDAVAYPLTMLLQCLGDGEEEAGVRQKIYHRICRLDPVQALNCEPRMNAGRK